MKKYLTILFICVMCLTFTSCVTTAYAETSVEDEDIQLVIRYGTPYYYGNTLAYYYYNGYYFYPYRYNNMWRYHRYHRPLPPPSRPHFEGRPHIHHNHHSGFGQHPHHPRNNHFSTPNRHPHNNRTIGGGHSRPHFGGRR